MSVFIELVTEPFRNTIDKFTSKRRAGADRVRRPLRGLEIKEDTFAIIKVIRSDGSPIPLLDQSSNTGTATETASFIIQSVQEARMEKHQIIETFGDAYIFFFGEAPRFIDVHAMLINSNDFNWEAEWWENYELYFRGTRSVELGARTYLFYDDSIVEGFMLQAQASKMSDQPLCVSLQFRMFVTNYRNVSMVGDPNFPIRASVLLPASVPSLQQSLNSEQINALVGSTSGLSATGFAQGGFDLDIEHPLRSLVSDNLDEFTAAPPENNIDNPFSALYDQIVEDLEEAQVLLDEAIGELSALGADVDNPDFMQAMGMGPNYNTRSGISIGSGARFGGATSFGIGASTAAGAGGSIGGTSGFSFGGSVTSSFGGSFSASGGTQIGGGFISNGQALTNANSVSGLSSNSAGASYGGGSGVGASVAIGGSPSAFAIGSFDGTLDTTSQATAFASVSVSI